MEAPRSGTPVAKVLCEEELMGTRDYSHIIPKGGRGRDSRPRKAEPGKIPVTEKTKYEDVEQVIEHNPLSGKQKTA